MAKRRATAAEQRHLERVANLPCAACYLMGDTRDERVEVHHVREGQGLSQRASHFLTVPLHVSCHRGPMGIHGDRTLLKIGKLTEDDLLAWTIEQLTRKAS